MIFVRLSGGLGNQLFQYGAAFALAKLHRTDVVLDLQWYRDSHWFSTKRVYELWRYPLQGREPHTSELVRCAAFGSRLLRLIPALRGRWVARERKLGFDPLFFNLPNGVYLDGYWQSYRYLEPVEEELRAMLKPSVPLAAADLVVAERIACGKAVSLHIRRGDYVTSRRAADLHGICSLDYYASALEYVQQFVEGVRLFVFSDDSDWARANFAPACETFYVDHNKAEDGFQDLRLMAMCDAGHIIANSTFSWWAAWLNESSAKVVVAPGRWFVKQSVVPDLLPPSWIRI